MTRENEKQRTVTLEFDLRKHRKTDDFHFNISAIARAGDHLWLGSDESTTIERLSRSGDGRFAAHTVFPLGEYLELPAGESEEVDIEGLTVDGDYLWITGSHSLKREKTNGGAKPKKEIKRLSKMVRESNRFIMGRIPLAKDGATGATSLVKSCADPLKAGGRLTAAQLFGTGQTNVLVDTLRDDPHLARFLAIPCKENGFDIEGLEAHGDRVFLGLRGPVVGGWALVLELEVEPIADHLLSLKRIGPHGAYYRKHFLDLDGLGVRDLCRDGEDLLILAGPTMDLDGHVLVLRWKNAIKARKQQIVERARLRDVLHVRFDPTQPGFDRAEGMTLFRDGRTPPALLIAYDSPSGRRCRGEGGIEADLFPLHD
jgi:Protein of unknown function (DUF3616)